MKKVNDNVKENIQGDRLLWCRGYKRRLAYVHSYIKRMTRSKSEGSLLCGTGEQCCTIITISSK